jgi:response regulator RpfG family c-di-GMP phosphodiesterase
MIEASSEMFQHDSMSEFLSSILEQVSTFYQDDLEMVFVREKEEPTPSGFIVTDNKKEMIIIAAKGRYQKFIGENIGNISELSDIYDAMLNEMDAKSRVSLLDNGFIVKHSENSRSKNFIFVEGSQTKYQIELINLFLTNYSLALDNFYMDRLISETQEQMIFTLGEVIESQFEETSGHLKRVTDILCHLAKKAGLPKIEVEFTKIAGALHDVGKIGIPSDILKKPGKLTPEEFEIIKNHTRIGHKILSKSKLEVFQIAAEIALHHHEKYDGSGYPDGLKGEEISIYSRMMAVADVFDAMTHKRVYKDALSEKETLAYMQSEKGRHFDPDLIDHLLAILKEE